MDTISMGFLGLDHQYSRKRIAPFPHRNGLFEGKAQMDELAVPWLETFLQDGSCQIPSRPMIEVLRGALHIVLKIYWKGMTIGGTNHSFPQLESSFARALDHLKDRRVVHLWKTVLDPVHQILQTDKSAVIKTQWIILGSVTKQKTQETRQSLCWYHG
jgi:hypothetical protein